MRSQVNKSKQIVTNKDSNNNDTAYKGGFLPDELTPREREELELMVALEYT